MYESAGVKVLVSRERKRVGERESERVGECREDVECKGMFEKGRGRES